MEEARIKYKVEIVAYESYGEINLGTFDVEADNEEEAELKAQKMARKKHPNLEDNDGTIGGLSLDDVLDYIDTAPTIEVKGNG